MFQVLWERDGMLVYVYEIMNDEIWMAFFF